MASDEIALLPAPCFDHPQESKVSKRSHAFRQGSDVIPPEIDQSKLGQIGNIIRYMRQIALLNFQLPQFAHFKYEYGYCI